MTTTRKRPDPGELDTVVLKSGAHTSFKAGACFMEAAAYFAGRPHSDHPPCVSPVIATFGRAWNDALDDDARQILKPYVLKVLNTATTQEDEKRRAWLATDWLVRTFAPAWLDLAGLKGHAARLRALPELTSDELASAAQETISAAYSAARLAADSAAYSAARLAADSAAYSAARLAADSAAYSAAGSAAGSALAPTVALMQQSALELLDRMIGVSKVEVLS